MRCCYYKLALIFLFTIPAYAQPSALSDSIQIAKLLKEIETAFTSRDPAPFERIYFDGYVGVRGRPVYNAFEQLLAMVKSDAAALKAGKKLDFETLSFENEDPVIRISGDAATVTGVKKNLWRYKDSRCLNRYQSTDVFARFNGVWKLVLGHMTLIPCAPMPWQPAHPAVSGLRNQTKFVNNISESVESELRRLISSSNDDGSDAFAAEYIFTSTSNEISSDNRALLGALLTPTARSGERYRDDEAYLSFGAAAAYIFRIRSLSKGITERPDPPVTFTVIFAKLEGSWKIIASHASALTD